MSLQDLYNGVQLCNRRLIQTYKEDVDKIKNSDFLKDEDEVQKLAQAALEIYRADKDKVKKRIKDYNFDAMVEGMSCVLAEKEMEIHFPQIKTRVQELANEEGIKKFINEKGHEEYNTNLWRRKARDYTCLIREALGKRIAPHIAPILDKAIRDDESNCTIM